ncbi:glycogen-binding domain-containing protein [Deltaproteobacteria bacterium]|nr:glycogen-binding domain-containing protein [Deltaproteobacteria bacterium]
MNYFISMFMDNELALDEKVEFVKKVHKEKEFYHESLELLEQEKLIRSEPVASVPAVQFKKRKSLFNIPVFKSFGLLASAGATAAIVMLFLFSLQENPIISSPYRFVIYKPEVSKVEISGSFIDWKVLPLNRIGSSGYWEIELDVPQGEHRYTYILEEGERVADPTMLTREHDDFGGENSILFVEA